MRLDLKPGDRVRWRQDPQVVREIVDVRDAGYGWRYPDMGEHTPAGGENYFLSENSTDPFFELGWERAPRLDPPDAPS